MCRSAFFFECSQSFALPAVPRIRHTLRILLSPFFLHLCLSLNPPQDGDNGDESETMTHGMQEAVVAALAHVSGANMVRHACRIVAIFVLREKEDFDSNAWELSLLITLVCTKSVV